MSIETDYLESLVATRQEVVDEVRGAGGIDFDELCAKPPDSRGSMVDFKRLGGLTARGIKLGFKQFKHTAHWELDGFAEEVATLRHIGGQGPQYLGMLPRIHYEIRDDSDMPLGILTEDFTLGGRKVGIGEVPILGLTAMFSNPDVIQEDHASGMIGIFQDGNAVGQTVTTSHIIDVTPLYATHRFDTGDDDLLPNWLSEEIGFPVVAAKLGELRIRTDELS